MKKLTAMKGDEASVHTLQNPQLPIRPEINAGPALGRFTPPLKVAGQAVGADCPNAENSPYAALLIHLWRETSYLHINVHYLQVIALGKLQCSSHGSATRNVLSHKPANSEYPTLHHTPYCNQIPYSLLLAYSPIPSY
jgi:hypothetical protein